MSYRTLVEFNHDLAGDIDRDPDAFVRAILEQMRMTGPPREIPGGRVIGTRHHTEPHYIRWGEHVDAQGAPLPRGGDRPGRERG